MTNMYIVKMMSCDNNKNEDECIENKCMNECAKSIYNKYEDERDIYIIKIKIKFKKLNT